CNHCTSGHSHLIQALPSTPAHPSPLACSTLFLFNDPSTPQIYTLSLHDALPISIHEERGGLRCSTGIDVPALQQHVRKTGVLDRSEEHTSELQSRGHLVCRLLLEKKKKKKTNNNPKSYAMT